MFDLMRKNKLPGRGYKLLAPRQAQLVPWHEVAVDLIGPWEMEMHGYTLSFMRHFQANVTDDEKLH